MAIFGQFSVLEGKNEGNGLFDTFKRAISGKVRYPYMEPYGINPQIPKRTNSGIISSAGLPTVGEYEGTGMPLLVCKRHTHPYGIWNGSEYSSWLSPVLVLQSTL